MRNIKYIVLHCSGTAKTTKVESIIRYWKEEMRWKNPGYHFIIEANGNEHQLQSLDKVANGVAGHNSESVHVCTIGGMEYDDRTPQQMRAQMHRIRALQKQFPNAQVMGHRDFPGVKKSCPGFDVKKWIQNYSL